MTDTERKLNEEIVCTAPETYFLCHGCWGGTNQTDVYKIDCHRIIIMIQHDWSDWKLAQDFILKALNKKWRASRIKNLMLFIKDRYKR